MQLIKKYEECSSFEQMLIDISIRIELINMMPKPIKKIEFIEIEGKINEIK